MTALDVMTGPVASELGAGRSHDRPGTLLLILLVPPAMIGCAWLAQRQGTLLLLTGCFLGMRVLLAAWAMCGVGAGMGVAVSRFAFMLFVGPP
ncbi:hypothetical protein ACWGLF_11220 [Streptomyces puniciscabiei]